MATDAALVPVHQLPVRMAGAADVLDRWLSARKPTTLAAYRQDIADFADWLGVDPATATERLLADGLGAANALLADYVRHLKTATSRRTGRPAARATINRRVAALRSLVKVARVIGVVTWVPEVPREKVKPYRDTRGPGKAGVRRLVAKVQERDDAKGARDHAILRLLHDLGLRRGEVVSLDLAHLELVGDEPRAWVQGKGAEEGDPGREALSLPVETVAALRSWLAYRGAAPGPLFTNVDRAGKGERLTGRSVHRIVGRLGLETEQRVRPHGIRHTAITAVATETGDMFATQQFSRHADWATLKFYFDAKDDVRGKMARLIAAGL